MKQFGILLFFCLGLIVFGCDSEPSSNGGDTTTSTDTTTDNENDAPEVVIEQPVKPDCKIEGSVLATNEFWAKDENLIVTVVAAPETNDPDFGESHRVLEVYDGNTCERVMREVLPVNLSPDYPYYLSDITYNNLSRLIAIRGFDKFYIFNLENRKLTGPIRPKFLNERYVEDAQAGMIKRLEVWEDFLVGYAQSMGSFVFNLKTPNSPEAVLPAAEYEIQEGTEYNSLFLLISSDEENGYQALLPDYNYETESFSIGALLEKPSKLEPQIAKNVRDNRFIVIKELLGGTESRPIGIDMENKRKINIPNDIAQQKTTAIVEWMKKQ
jgi:hypothetical protein